MNIKLNVLIVLVQNMYFVIYVTVYVVKGKMDSLQICSLILNLFYLQLIIIYQKNWEAKKIELS